MTARQRQPAGEIEHVGWNGLGIDDVEVGQGQCACLVEHDGVDLGNTLDGIAGIDQHAGAEHRASHHRLHRGNGEPERAGTGDDQHGDRGNDRIVPARACQHPAEHGQRRRDMNHRRIEPRGAIGELHVTRARLQRVFKEAGDLGQQRAFGSGRDPDPERTRHVHGAGIDLGALLCRGMARLAGDQALIDLGTALDHLTVDGRALARPQQHDVAGADARGRHLADLVGADELGRRLRLQRGEIAGDRPGPPPHVLVEIAPRQQEG
ncbi:hypothetical protein ES703_48308 [subsurface metagenome]